MKYVTRPYTINRVMTRYYGVHCKTCHIRIAFGRVEEADGTTLVVYAAPLEAVPCNACGHSHLYGSDDLFEFAEGDDIPLSNIP